MGMEWPILQYSIFRNLGEYNVTKFQFIKSKSNLVQNWLKIEIILPYHLSKLNIKYLSKLWIKIIRNCLKTKDALLKYAETVWKEMRDRPSSDIWEAD